MHRLGIGDLGKPTEEKNKPNKLRPSEGTTVQLCGDIDIVDKVVNGNYAMGK